MIEKKLKTTHGNLRVKIPTRLEELTLGQLIAMQDKSELNDLEAISILSGVTVEELSNVKSAADFTVFTGYIHSLAHQIKYLYNSDEIPCTVTFTIKDCIITVDVMRNLSVEPAGAFMAAREIIAGEISEYCKQFGETDWQQHFKPSLKACCQVLAHYFYCRVTGNKYNEHQAEAFTFEIEKLRVVEALPISKYFFMNYPALSSKKTSCWHRLLQYWRKRQESRLLKSLNTSIR